MLGNFVKRSRLKTRVDSESGKPGDKCGMGWIQSGLECHKGKGGADSEKEPVPPKSIQQVANAIAQFDDGPIKLPAWPNKDFDTDEDEDKAIAAYSQKAKKLIPGLSDQDGFEFDVDAKTFSRDEYLESLSDPGADNNLPAYDYSLTESVYGKNPNRFIFDDGKGTPWEVSRSGKQWGVSRAGFSESEAKGYITKYAKDESEADALLSYAVKSSAELKKDAANQRSQKQQWESIPAMKEAFERTAQLVEAADNPQLRIYAMYSDPTRYNQDEARSLDTRLNYWRYVCDARQSPSTKKTATASKPANKVPGQPCGAGWISAAYNCSPDKVKQASKRLKSKEGSAEKARFTKRMRTAKGKTMGPRGEQIETRMRKKTEKNSVSGEALGNNVTSIEGRVSKRSRPAAKTNKTAKEPVADFRLAAKLKKMEKESPSDMAPVVKAVLAQKKKVDRALNELQAVRDRSNIKTKNQRDKQRASKRTWQCYPHQRPRR